MIEVEPENMLELLRYFGENLTNGNMFLVFLSYLFLFMNMPVCLCVSGHMCAMAKYRCTESARA